MIPEPKWSYTIYVNKSHALKVSLILGAICGAFFCWSLGLLVDPFGEYFLRGLSEIFLVFHWPFTIYFLYRKHTPVVVITDQYLHAGTRSYWFNDSITEAKIVQEKWRTVMVLKNKKGELWKISWDEKICDHLDHATQTLLEKLPTDNLVHKALKENLC